MLESDKVQQSAYDMLYYKKLKVEANNHQDKAIPQVAKQFESLFFSSLMKQMRQSNEWLSKDSPFSSQSVKTFEEMLDGERSTQLANSKGLGIADVLIQQLDKLHGVKNQKVIDTAKSEKPLISLEQKAPGIFQKISQKAEELLVKGVFNSPTSFVNTLWPMANLAAKTLGVSPKVLLAQAALETGWGKKIIQNENGESSFNLFNIKANKSWNLETVSKKTLEYENGVADKEMASFKKYSNFFESFKDYIDLIKSHKRYQNAIDNATNPKAYLQGLYEGGYATDPQYVNKVFKIYNSDFLDKVLTARRTNQ